MPGNLIRVMAVDDEESVRSVMELVLGIYDDLEMVGTAANGEEAVRLAADEHPDVILMDVKMPVMDGITATRLIVQHDPAIRVIMLSTFQDKDLVEQASIAGASAYLSKGISTEQLVDSIRAAGRAYA